MNYTCRNCKHRESWDCEDYNWGYWDKEACRDRFELDIHTLSPMERENIRNLARAIMREEKEENE